MADNHHTCHFLLIENEREQAFALEKALQTAEFRRSWALCRNVSEAKAYLIGAGMYEDRSRFPMPHVLITDLDLGSESGLDLLDWCESRDELREVPIVVLAGSAGPDELILARERGADEVIQKSFEPAALASAFSSLAERYAN